ncbi:single-stranded-DNA-specific exonuclease RecJ [Desulfohalobiaceae bacterium Ax17]|uniref:single-stranded-DNA-specific exonuclease RecJ n=1 Tax=Desulfovulcanus ferrireducens TaxID=2831190 RepID=UPI00207BB0A9|nr:single-stranded-DNA-specific exonuclease RecJ [Desulfovulcanus ferrireducens]MBT8763572.1 single-stranded-DNA-specific exonuclease RecJ [Desulfovulcanus ferrireducens]
MYWELRDQPDNPAKLYSWAQKLNISPLLAQLLYQRGLTTLSQMHFFLNPGLRYLSPLENWPNLLSAARLVAQSITRGEKLAVWGDYDVDGITATAMVKDFFSRREYKIDHYIPNRLESGYGLNIEGLEQLAGQGVKTLITVDCGISSHAEIARAKELGLKLIVTDHHLPQKDLPPADIIVNPKLSSCPCPELAGVGVAFLLCAALNTVLPGDKLDIRQFLDLVALGTIADIVDLTGENRILVKNGLLLLNEARRPGIRALKEVSGLGESSSLGSGDVGYILAPRINAAGRIGQPELALELLLTEDIQTARTLARQLDRLNTDRKKIEDEILEQAREQAAHLTQIKAKQGLVLYSPDWHPGVIGIVASRIVDEFYRPCLILTKENGLLKGSGRSIPEFDLYQGLSGLSHVLHGFGGHRQAAGLSLLPENLDQLKSLFNRQVIEELGPEPVKPRIVLDACLNFKDLTPTLLKELELLQPFGPGNPRPVFLGKDLRVQKQKLFGQGKHLGLFLRDEQRKITLRGQVWRKGEKWGQNNLENKSITIAFTPKLSLYNGLVSIDLNIKEILQVE